jgi:hypothetical protein
MMTTKCTCTYVLNAMFSLFWLLDSIVSHHEWAGDTLAHVSSIATGSLLPVSWELKEWQGFPFIHCHLGWHPVAQDPDILPTSCQAQVLTIRICANSPRVNALNTSLSWFIFNLHTTDMYVYFIYDNEEIYWMRNWNGLLVACTDTIAHPVRPFFSS